MSNLIGHNNPPSDEELLQEKLKNNYAKELAGIDNLSVYAPPETVDETNSGELADFLDKVKKAKKSIEEAHKKEKDTFLKLGRIVDAFKNINLDKLSAIAKPVESKQFAYLEAKAAAERERLRLIAEQERIKAEALAAQAEAHAKEGIQDTAEDLITAAVEHEITSNRIDSYADSVKDSKIAKTISASGAISGLRTAWAGDIVDIGAVDLEKLRHYLKPEHIQLAVNAFVKDGGRELAGVKIHQKSTLR